MGDMNAYNFFQRKLILDSHVCVFESYVLGHVLIIRGG